MCSIVYFFYSLLLERFRYENVRGIATGLIVYANDYDALPPLDKWCDKLVEEADFGSGHFQPVINRQEGMIGYAINKNLEGLKFSELDKKVVLAFEAIGPWNQSGGPELAKKWKRKKIAVVFVSGYMDFVTKEEIDKLKWKP